LQSAVLLVVSVTASIDIHYRIKTATGKQVEAMEDTRIEQIYRFQRRVRRVLSKLKESPICEQNKEAIVEFCKFSSEGDSTVQNLALP
jgi:hypothetical protein